jgi:hypothetical protein
MCPHPCAHLQGDAASRDPFFDLDGGFSDDEDGDGHGRGGFASKFKIVIKSKEV